MGFMQDYITPSLKPIDFHVCPCYNGQKLCIQGEDIMEINILPTKKQLAFLDWEFGVFFHFGIRTYYEGHQDWDGRDMPSEAFMPEELNCRQWIKTVRDCGAKYAILTTKHHDGFANWPSAYTEYSVKNTPWKDGKGDVVREFTEACREYGVGEGLYYSPAQKDFETMSDKEYDDYFINQISELLSNYGKIDYLWFDGCGSENHEYDRDRIIGVIRSLQPDIMIFSMWDPDTRWVGNEEGITPLGCRYVVESARTSIREQESQWLAEPRFLPYECDCKIRRKNWFYSENDEHLLRSVEDLMGLYYYSVGRGGNLLLNIAPDRRGLLPDADCRRLAEFAAERERRFAAPLECTVEKQGDIYAIQLNQPALVDHIVLEEELAGGQKIFGFRFSLDYNVYMPLAEGKTVGHKQICRFPAVYGEKFALEILDHAEEYALKNIRIYAAE